MAIVSSASPGIEILTAAKQSFDGGAAANLGSQAGATSSQVIVPDAITSNNEGNLESSPTYVGRHFLLRPRTQLSLGGGIGKSAIPASAGTGYAVGDDLTISGGTGNIAAVFNVDAIGAISASPSAGGTGYVVGDWIFVSGGTFTKQAVFQVATVGGAGDVTSVTLLLRGAYTSTPGNPASTTGGTGTGCTLTVTYGGVSVLSLVTHGDYFTTPSNPASTTGGSGSGATLTVTYEDGEEIRFITGDTSNTLDVNEDWINPPSSGEDWAVCYILEDVATVTGLTLRSQSNIFEASRRIWVGDFDTSDFSFFGIAEGKALEISDEGTGTAGFFPTVGCVFITGYPQGGVPINGGYLFGINNGAAEDIIQFDDGARCFMYDMQLRCARADLEIVTSVDTGGDSVRFVENCGFFNATDDADLDGWTIRNCFFASEGAVTNRLVATETSDIDGIVVVNTQGFLTDDDTVTETIEIRNPVFVANIRHVFVNDDKTWVFVNAIGWIANASHIVFENADLNSVRRKFSINLTAQQPNGTVVERALTMVYEGLINQNLPIDNQQLTDANGQALSDVLREIINDAPTAGTSFDAAIADDGGSYTNQTTAASNATANDMNLLPSVPVDGDAYLFGDIRRFSGLEINVGTAGEGTYTIQWQYWNGSSWSPLSNVSDGSNSYHSSTTTTITWDVPTDWVLHTVNGQGPFYYVRGEKQSGTVTTVPLGTQADFQHTSAGYVSILFGDFAIRVFKYGFLPFVVPQDLEESITPNGLSLPVPMITDDGIITTSSPQATEDARGIVVRRQLSLPYDDQFASFTVGARVRGSSSLATGIIVSDASSTLFLDRVVGRFVDDEEIRDDNATEGGASVNSVTGGSKRPFNLIHYDNGSGSPTPAIGDTITGLSSGQTGVVVAVFGDPNEGFLLLENRSTTAFTNNELLDSNAGGSDWLALADLTGGSSSTDLDFNHLVDLNNASSVTLRDGYEYISALMAKRFSPLVFQADGLVFTDFTNAAKLPSITGDVDIYPATPAVGDAFYVGDQDTLFSSIFIDMATAMTGTPTVVWEYWNGSIWATLPGINDGTNSFRKADGLRVVTWTIPTDWETIDPGNNIEAYWVRARLSVLGTGTADADQVWTNKEFLDIHTWGAGQVDLPLKSGPDGFFSERNSDLAEGVFVANGTGTVDFWTADDGTQFVPPVTYTLTLTGLKTGSEVRIYDNVGGDPSDFEREGTENSGTTFNHSYTHSGADIPVIIVIHHLDYKYRRIFLSLTNSNQSIPIEQEVDRSYSNP